MKLIKYNIYNDKYALGIADFGGYISILLMGFTNNTYSGLRVRKDKLGELVAALCSVYSGKKNIVTVANGSPDLVNSNIVVKRTGYCIRLSKEHSWSGGLHFYDKVALPLIQLLESDSLNDIIEVEEFINPAFEDGVQRWIFVLNFGNRVVISNLDEHDWAQGMIIPRSSIYTVSNKLLREYNTRKKNWAPNSQFDMANPYGRG